MEFSPLRRIAMRLACAHAEDRLWILAQLARDERQQIEALLEEVNLLGLAADPAIVAAVMAQPPAPSASLLPESARVQARVTKAQHPFWGALVLQLQPQEQRREVLEGLPNGARIRRWESAFAKQEVPPALVHCLQHYLELPEVSDGRS